MAKILSIEIDNRNIKILEGSKSGASLSVYKSIFLDVPSNSVDDGKIIDMDSVVEIIEKALVENNIKTKSAIFTINTNSIITRNIELPILKSKADTMSMIKNELDQLLSVDLNQYKLIYKKLEKVMVDEVEKGKYIVYGLPIGIYNHYIELSEKLKLEMVALDLSFNSLDKIAENKVAINGYTLKSSSATAFIDFGYNNITFSVLNNGKNDFSRISSNGIHDMVRNFSTVYNLNKEDALREIEKLSLVENHEKIIDVTKINMAEDSIRLWIDEFNRYIRYYNSNNKDKQIEKIYIYGTFAIIEGLEKFLESNLNVDVELINNISGLIIKDNKIDFDIKTYFNVLLSLYINKKDVDFLTDKNKKHKSKFSAGIVVMIVSAVVVLTLAYNLYSYIVQQTSLEKELAIMDQFMENEENIKLNTEAESLKNKVALLEKYKKEVVKVQDAIKGEDAVTTIMFEEVGKSLPLGSKVNSMSIDKSTIQLQCSSNSKLEVAQFEKNLKNVEFIDYVYIPAVVETAEGGRTTYSYSVVCEIKDVMTDEAQ